MTDALSTGEQPTPPAVAICIPTFNHAAHLGEAVRSAFAQEYPGPLDVWVSDDASTDDTPAVLAALRSEFPQLNVIIQPGNLGIAANASAALRAATTAYAVRLDSDDALSPNFLSELVPMMEAQPGAGYAHSGVVEIDEHGHVGRIRRLVRDTGYLAAEPALRAALSGYRTTANILLFRTEALRRTAYYDGRPDFVEDYDLSIRLADAGYGNVYNARELACYRVWTDPSGMRARRKSMQLEGFRRIFDEAIEPAWSRRGWDLRPVRRQRRRLAARHCSSCFAPQYDSFERDELVAMLLAVGGGPAVRARLAICHLGGAELMERIDRLEPAVRNAAKMLLARSRKWRLQRAAACGGHG